MLNFSAAVVGGLFLMAGSAQAQLLPPIFPSIFGPDNRIVAPTHVYPYRPVVSVTTPKSATTVSVCTGAWIGPRLVLTAAHCLQGQLPGSSVRVQTADGRAQAFARAPYITAQGEQTVVTFRDSSQDWAILRLGTALGRTGWLPVDAEFTVGPRFTQPVALPGYSTDRKGLTVHEGCLVMQARRDGTFGHDCDMTSGASGGPVIHCEAPDQCAVIGVNVTEVRQSDTDFNQDRYGHGVANRAVQARMFADAVEEALAVDLDTFITATGSVQ